MFILGNTVTAKCSHCKRTLDADYVPSHEQKCLDKSMRCPTCGHVVPLGKWFDHECNTERVKGMPYSYINIYSHTIFLIHSFKFFMEKKNVEFLKIKNVIVSFSQFHSVSI